MSKEKFHNVLTGAVAGSHKDVEQILELYMPLIDKHSYVNGRLEPFLKYFTNQVENPGNPFVFVCIGIPVP